MDVPAPGRADDTDAIVVLPYTRVKRSRGAPSVYRMSHFTARGILAGLELYRQGAAPRFILPGEQRKPATSDLEQSIQRVLFGPSTCCGAVGRRHGACRSLTTTTRTSAP